MPCCRSPCQSSDPQWKAVGVSLRTPLRGQRGRGFVRNRTPCHQKAQSQSAICQAVFGYAKPFFPPGQLFISPEQEDIPRSESSEPCPALSPGATRSIQRETGVCSHFCQQLVQSGAPGTRTAFLLRGALLSGSPKPLTVRLLHRLAKQLVFIHLSPC